MTTLPPRVSVVVPAYNASAFIDHALASVAAQQRPAAEVVVVDDGSNDATAERAEAWRDRLAPTQLILHRQRNLGLSAARNAGILASTGDIIAFLDSDDTYLPDHLAVVAPAFIAMPDLALCFVDMLRINPRVPAGSRMLDTIRTDLLRISQPAPGADMLIPSSAIRALYLRGPCILPSSWVMRRRAFAETGLFDATLRYGEDVDFLWRAFAVGRFAWIDRVTVHRLEHGGNLSGSANSERAEPIALRCFAALRRCGQGMTEDDAVALDRLIDEAGRVVSYHASSGGLRRYLRVRRAARRMVGRRLPAQPRMLARAVVKDLLGIAKTDAAG